MTTTAKDRARAFHALHHGGRILVLPNAWDAASARIFELAGAPAVATTSSGLAASLGYPDGERIPCALVLGAVRRITATVAIPLSVDFERGYAETPAEVAREVGGETARHPRRVRGAAEIDVAEALHEPHAPVGPALREHQGRERTVAHGEHDRADGGMELRYFQRHLSSSPARPAQRCIAA